MRIGIYGGTFNPPHTGHRKAAREAIGALGLILDGFFVLLERKALYWMH